MTIPQGRSKGGFPIRRMNGKRLGGEPGNEADYFYKCSVCSQTVDKRDLGEVFHHELPGHDPLPTQ
jgi:hypothetical protein